MRLFEKIPDKLGHWLRSENAEFEICDIDLIAPLTYGTLPQKLMNGTRESILMALRYKQEFPKAVIAFSNPSQVGFADSDKIEYELKQKLLQGAPHVCARSCVNSVTEADSVCEAISFTPKRILVICGETHSLRVRLIWQKIFPKSLILIRTIPFAFEYQPDHPFWVERYAWRWLAVDIAAYVVTRVHGVDRMRSVVHTAG
jgi:hypothetical protein